MRVTMVSTFFLAILLVFPELATAQETPQKKPLPKAPQAKPDPNARQLGLQSFLKTSIPSSLEEFLAKALKENPDIRLAESKVREAEAQLTKTRLDVMQKVVKLHHEIAAYKALVKDSQDQLALKTKLFGEGALPLATLEASRQALQQAKANLAKAEADVPFILGSQPAAIAFSPDGKKLLFTPGPGGRIVVWDAATGKLLNEGVSPPATASIVRGPQLEKIRALLDAPVQGEFTSRKLLGLFQERLKGFNLHINSFAHKIDPDRFERQTLGLTEPVSLGAAMQWFEDTMGFRFVLRAYGIVVVPSGNLPPGAVLLLEVWKEPAGKTASPKTMPRH